MLYSSGNPEYFRFLGRRKFSIHEIIFRLHLEKQSYDKAVNDIKNVFNIC